MSFIGTLVPPSSLVRFTGVTKPRSRALLPSEADAVGVGVGTRPSSPRPARPHWTKSDGAHRQHERRGMIGIVEDLLVRGR